MMSQHIPSVLEGRGKESGISTVRALRQIQRLLEGALMTEWAEDPSIEDRLNASIDDVKMMLERVL